MQLLPDEPMSMTFMSKFDVLLAIANAKKSCTALAKIEDDGGDIPFQANKHEWSTMKHHLDELASDVPLSQGMDIIESAPDVSSGPCKTDIMTSFGVVLRAANTMSENFVQDSWHATTSPIDKNLHDYTLISKGMMDGTDWKAGLTEFEIDHYVAHACDTAFKQKAISAKIKLGKEELERKLNDAEEVAAELGKTEEFQKLKTQCQAVIKTAMITKMELALIQIIKKKAEPDTKSADIEELLDKCAEHNIDACEDLTDVIYEYCLKFNQRHGSS